MATFYTIFGTNILIKCPVPVPVCCMFYVSQKTHPYQTESKWNKKVWRFFGMFMNLGKKNQRKTMPKGATRQGACPRGVGAPLTLMATR